MQIINFLSPVSCHQRSPESSQAPKCHSKDSGLPWSCATSATPVWTLRRSVTPPVASVVFR